MGRILKLVCVLSFPFAPAQSAPDREQKSRREDDMGKLNAIWICTCLLKNIKSMSIKFEWTTERKDGLEWLN